MLYWFKLSWKILLKLVIGLNFKKVSRLTDYLIGREFIGNYFYNLLQDTSPWKWQVSHYLLTSWSFWLDLNFWVNLSFND